MMAGSEKLPAGQILTKKFVLVIYNATNMKLNMLNIHKLAKKIFNIWSSSIVFQNITKTKNLQQIWNLSF